MYESFPRHLQPCDVYDFDDPGGSADGVFPVPVAFVQCGMLETVSLRAGDAV